METATTTEIAVRSPYELLPTLDLRGRTTSGRKIAYPSDTLTDVGNANRLVTAHGNDIRFCSTWKKWLVWDGARWRLDEGGLIFERAKATASSMFIEAGNLSDTRAQEQVAKHALSSQSERAIRAMVALACTDARVSIVSGRLDADPFLLNCSNGTLDLKTGELKTHAREDLITKLADVAYDAHAECPTFNKFLHRIFADNNSLVAYVQSVLGYALTGVVYEKCLFLFIGEDGDNGKTTLLEIIRAATGDYAGQIPIESLMVKRFDSGVPNDLAQLHGRRFVTSSETEAGRRLAEAKVKQLTGGGKLQARFMYGEYFTFDNTFKIFIDANHKPEIRGTDRAMWGRFKVVPFNVTIPKEEIDKCLFQKLTSELSGILSWLVQGCLSWQQQGLNDPPEVNAAVEKYRSEMDGFGRFLNECCEVAPDHAETADDLYTQYEQWAGDEGEDNLLTKKAFGMRLGKHPGISSLKVNDKRSWKGLRIKTPHQGSFHA